MPTFSRLRVRKLLLTGKDDLSADGSVGNSLREAIEPAFEAAGT